MKSFLKFLGRAFKYLFGTKRVWRKPEQADLLIIDRGTASPVNEMFSHHKLHIMDIRGESINMWALFRGIPKIRLGALAYLESYIDAVNPKLILSRTDNNATLWQLKRRPVTYKVALIQNGWRLDVGFEISDLLRTTGPHGQWEIDRLFAFGPAWISQIPSYVKFRGISSGSNKANNFQFSRERDSESVALISSYRASTGKSHNYLGVLEQYRIVDAVLSARKRKLVIVGNTKQDGDSWQELNYYEQSFKASSWHLQSRDNSLSSYQALQNVSCVIVESSSLGYESFGMGLRVGFFAFRPQHRQDRRFGKPLEFGEKGPFWTNDPSADEISRILDYLLTVTDEQWERDSGWIRDQLMTHDYGNTKLRAYVEGILADNLESA